MSNKPLPRPGDTPGNEVPPQPDPSNHGDSDQKAKGLGLRSVHKLKPKRNSPLTGKPANSVSFGGGAQSMGTGLTGSTYSGDKPAAPTKYEYRRNEEYIRNLNYTLPEDFEIPFDMPKDFSSGKQVGKLNTYNFDFRKNKVFGYQPAEHLFERSIDLITRDMLYYSASQAIKYGDPTLTMYPTKTKLMQPDGSLSTVDLNIDQSNVLHRWLKVELDTTGAAPVVELSFETNNIPSTAKTDHVNKISGQGYLTDINNAARDYTELVEKVRGNEKLENSVFLTKTTLQPKNHLALFRDVDGITGAELHMAYLKLQTAYAFQINKLAKDGMRVVGPVREMFRDNCNLVNRYIPEVHGLDQIDEGKFKGGSAALYAYVLENKFKYTEDKGKALQPRGPIDMAISLLQKHIGKFAVRESFIKDVQDNEYFSTMQTDYDPVMPILATDVNSIIHQIDLNNFITSDKTAPRAIAGYEFKEIGGSSYYREIRSSLVDGLFMWFRKNARRVMKGIKNTESSTTSFKIPCTHSTTFFSAWDMLLALAVDEINNSRTTDSNAYIELDKLMAEGIYPFSQLKTFEEGIKPVNYVLKTYVEPLETKPLDAFGRISWSMPELFIPMNEMTGNRILYLLPYYMSLESLQSTGVYDGDNIAVSYPAIRRGMELRGLQDFYDVDPRELRLRSNIITQIPTKHSSGVIRRYSYSKMDDGLPAVSYSDSELTVQKILELPRQLGKGFVAPAGVVSPTLSKFATVASGATRADTCGFKLLSDPYRGETSYKIYSWYNNGDTDVNDIVDNKICKAILEDPNYSIYVGSDLANKYVMFEAIVGIGDGSDEFESASDIVNSSYQPQNYGIFLSADLFMKMNSDNTVSLVDNMATHKPYTARDKSILTGGDYSNSLRVATLHAYYWFMMQRLPFVLNPFDAMHSESVRTDGTDNTIVFDPFDLAYIYGLAGFFSMLYNGDAKDRWDAFQYNGHDILTDPWLESK